MSYSGTCPASPQRFSPWCARSIVLWGIKFQCRLSGCSWTPRWEWSRYFCSGTAHAHGLCSLLLSQPPRADPPSCTSPTKRGKREHGERRELGWGIALPRCCDGRHRGSLTPYTRTIGGGSCPWCWLLSVLSPGAATLGPTPHLSTHSVSKTKPCRWSKKQPSSSHSPKKGSTFLAKCMMFWLTDLV